MNSSQRLLVDSAQRILCVALGLAIIIGDRARAAEVSVRDPDGALGRLHAPVAVAVRLTASQRRAATTGRLQVRERTPGQPGSATPVSAQILASGEKDVPERLCWLLPPGPIGKRTFRVEEAPQPPEAIVSAMWDQRGGAVDLREAGRPVLRYNFQTVQPGDRLTNIAPANLMYARARSDYIHPLYGPGGEPLTLDWPVDHPHHRGIYWAWPEVDWRGQRGDLHALQKVFARPSGDCRLTSGPVFAQFEAENVWRWEDREPLVRERAILRAYRATGQDRRIDLEFRFTALNDPVLLARRETTHYGGLNLRFGAVQNQAIATHTDPTNAHPCMAWAEISGTFADAAAPAGVVILQNPRNPCYPGDWVQYPNLNWLQPTFPTSGTRYELKKEQTLVLQFRLWIHAGQPASEGACADEWRAYVAGAALPEHED